jgi:hypothetical protein
MVSGIGNTQGSVASAGGTGTAAGAGSPSGKTSLDATLVFAALGLAIVVVGYRVRK